MFYTYILEGISQPGRRYIGHTADLKQRLVDHNAGKCPHTAKFTPWKPRIYLAFETLEQKQRFERYLKTGSGHAFANKHFWLGHLAWSPGGVGKLRCRIPLRIR